MPIVLVFAGDFISGCGYRLRNATPMLRYNISSLSVARVENRTVVIGLEGEVRRRLEEKLFDYLNTATPRQTKECVSMVGEHRGAEMTRQGEHSVLACPQNSGREHSDHLGVEKADLVVRIINLEKVPTAFVVGNATGRQLGLRHEALLASSYQTKITIEIELREGRDSEGVGASVESHSSGRVFHKSRHQLATHFDSATYQSDLTGASRNVVQSDLRLESAVDQLSENIALEVFNVLTSMF